MSRLLSCLLLSCGMSATLAARLSKEEGKQTILKMSGCKAVDYTFSETKALLDTYKLDSRVYDATKVHEVFEYIVPLQNDENVVHLQHIFLIGMGPGRTFLMKHHGETWTYAPASYQTYLGGYHWKPAEVDAPEGKWLRSVSALDDGPRYSCVSSWQNQGARNVWNCTGTYAPIPGRETRDMGRKDYQGLYRKSQILVYDTFWLEREENRKVYEKDGEQTPFVEEVGKIFSIEVPETNCAAAKDWIKPRQEFWAMLRKVWDRVLSEGPYGGSEVRNGVSRFDKVTAIEKAYLEKGGDLQELSLQVEGIVRSYNEHQPTSRL